MVIIEDDEVTRVLLGKFLERLGHPARFFNTAEEALAKLPVDVPPLILLDWQLPGLDGIEFCRQFRKRIDSKPCYIIMITGADSPGIVESALEAGANDYLVKPLTFETLRTRLIVAERKVKELESTPPPAESGESLALRKDLEAGLERGELELYYQPIYALRIGPQIEGLEALLRWNHPVHGSISPARFIPLAEKSDLIQKLTRFVLAEGTAQLKRWLRERSDLYLSVNVSAGDLQDPTLAQTVRAALADSGLAPRNLQLEITETSAMKNREQATRLMQAFFDLGMPVAIDDFGTGYSSLAYLQNFKFDSLKIDRSFTRQLPENRHTMAITEAVLSLASRLEVKTVVEGVETPEQFETLKKMGFRRFQGYLLSRPVPAGQVPELIARKI